MNSTFYSNQPLHQRKFFTVSDVTQMMPAFKLMYELGPDGSVNNCERGENFHAQWRNFVREGVINGAGRPMELDFFEKVAGGITTDVDATTVYIKTNSDIDYNIFAESAATALTPGGDVWFTLARHLHSGNGEYSNVSEGGSLYLYWDSRTVFVHEVDRTVPYAHRVRVRPLDGTYTANIKAGQKMFFNTAKMIGNTSCPAPVSSWITDGYISKVMPYRFRQDFKIPKALDKPYQDVLQFAIIFDSKGNEIDSWEYKEMQNMREQLQLKRNLNYFLGEEVTNAALLSGTVVDDQYAGYNGYLNTVENAGGTIYDYPASQGFGLKADGGQIFMRQDSKKLSTEFIVLAGNPFMWNMENRGDVDFNKVSGACTFETFTRSGMNKDDIERLGIRSYRYGNYSLHFKPFDSLSDARLIGNGRFPNMGIMMPTQGLRDSLGRNVPPVEFFKPKGHEYREVVRDLEEIDGCEYIAGHAIQLDMMATHNPDKHIILNGLNF